MALSKTIPKTKNNFEDLLQNMDLDMDTLGNTAILSTNTLSKKTPSKKNVAKPITKLAEKTPIETPKKGIATKKIAPHSARPAPDLPAISDIFTSGFVKGIVLFLIISFNVILLKNCFLLTISTRQNFSGNTDVDAFLYGLAISMLMTIVLFHEENWQNGFCAGAMTLYINLMILVLYMGMFDFMIGAWWSLWAMSGLIVLLPVVGLFVMVIMLKPRK